MDEVTKWLKEGPAWLRYAVITQLLDSDYDVQSALQDSSIQKLVARLKDPYRGLGAFRTGAVSCETQGSAVWDLYFLADIGFKAWHLDIGSEVSDILKSQLPDGSFLTEPGIKSNYYCVSAIMLSILARIGYAETPPLTYYVERLLKEQHPGGGWHCEDYHSEACPMDNLNILMLLGQYEALHEDHRFNGALDFLLNHWENRDSRYRPSGFGIGRRYRSLQYPATKYGILRILDAVSLFPYGVSHPSFRDMLGYVQAKAHEGCYYAEMPPHAYKDFDFGHTEVPSRWITFLIRRIEKRAGNSQVTCPPQKTSPVVMLDQRLQKGE